MFANSFQSGPHVDVFDSKVNKQKNQFYQKLLKYVSPNGVKKEFDKQTKSYLLEVDGLSRLVFPHDDQKELCLVQRYLVLQIFIPIGFPWVIELGITDTTKTKRRVMLTSAISKVQTKFFHIRCPINHVKRGVWLNLGIDIYSYMNAFKGQTFRSLDQIIISAHCRLRRIFTMRQGLIEYSNQDQYFDYSTQQGKVFMPKQFQLNPDVAQTTQVIQYSQHFSNELEQKPITNSITNYRMKNIDKKVVTKQTQRKPPLSQKQKKQESFLQISKTPIQSINTKKSSGVKSKIDTGLGSSTKASKVINTINISKKQNIKQQTRLISQQKKVAESSSQQGQQIIMRTQQLRRQLQKYQDSEDFDINNKQIKPTIQDPKFITQSNYSKQQSLRQSINISPQKLVKQIQQQVPQQAVKYEQYQQDYEQYGQFQDSMQKKKQQTDYYQDSMDVVPQKQSVYTKPPDNMFPTSIITKKNKQTVVVQIRPQEQVDLIYDPVLECYYNTQTNMYYQLG